MDSWVRYEGQVKQRQQRELADTIIAKIEKELEDPKVLKQILDQSVKDVERKFATGKTTSALNNHAQALSLQSECTSSASELPDKGANR